MFDIRWCAHGAALWAFRDGSLEGWRTRTPWENSKTRKANGCGLTDREGTKLSYCPGERPCSVLCGSFTWAPSPAYSLALCNTMIKKQLDISGLPPQWHWL